jgi:hypothetical protein
MERMTQKRHWPSHVTTTELHPQLPITCFWILVSYHLHHRAKKRKIFYLHLNASNLLSMYTMQHTYLERVSLNKTLILTNRTLHMGLETCSFIELPMGLYLIKFKEDF